MFISLFEARGHIQNLHKLFSRNYSNLASEMTVTPICSIIHELNELDNNTTVSIFDLVRVFATSSSISNLVHGHGNPYLNSPTNIHC
jgi:hypothetical protein